MVRAKTINSRLNLIKYFDTFQLWSSKYSDYLSWKEAQDLVKNKSPQTIEGSNKIKFIKNSMNSNRTHFDWKHLSNFFL